MEDTFDNNWIFYSLYGTRICGRISFCQWETFERQSNLRYIQPNNSSIVHHDHSLCHFDLHQLHGGQISEGEIQIFTKTNQ